MIKLNSQRRGEARKEPEFGELLTYDVIALGFHGRIWYLKLRERNINIVTLRTWPYDPSIAGEVMVLHVTDSRVKGP
jgi:hypothetical protein